MIAFRFLLITIMLAVVGWLIDLNERAVVYREARRRIRPITHPWEYWPGRTR